MHAALESTVESCVLHLCNTYFNHLYEISKLLGGLQPLAVGHLGIVKPLGVHRVELHNQICKVSRNGILYYVNLQYGNRWVGYYGLP